MKNYLFASVCLITAFCAKPTFAADCNGSYDSWTPAIEDFRTSFGLDVREGHVRASSGDLVKGFFGTNNHITYMLSSVTRCTPDGYKVVAHSAAPMTLNLVDKNNFDASTLVLPHDDQCGSMSDDVRQFAAHKMNQFSDNEYNVKSSDITVCLDAGRESSGVRSFYVRALIQHSGDSYFGADLTAKVTYDGQTFKDDGVSLSSPSFPDTDNRVGYPDHF